MIQVKELKKQDKKNYIVNFLVDGVVSEDYPVSTDLVVEYRLLKDKLLNIELFNEFKIAQSLDKIMSQTIKYVIKYGKTLRETLNYLEKKNLTESEIDFVIRKLKQLHLLNDELLIHQFILNQLSSLNGIQKITFLLENKGFSEDLIKEAIASIDEQTIKENLNKLFKKRMSHYKNYSIKQAKIKMTQFLVSRGYNLSEVYAVIEENNLTFQGQINESELLHKELIIIRDKLLKTKIDNFQIKAKIIQKLLSKGYLYQDIIQVLERGSL